MGNFFPRWTNFLPLKLLFAFTILGMGAVAAITVYWTPKYSRVGFTPDQPIAFDHSLHAGQLGMDCRYCHSYVEQSDFSNIPSAQTCWNCHQFVKNDSPKLVRLREAMDTNYEGYTGKPIEWVRIHKIPDYAHFSHQVHVNRGVSCVNCHGRVNEMQVVRHDQSQSMGWCLDCHRHPERALRPLSEITNFDWRPEQTDRDEFYASLAKASVKSVEEFESSAKWNGFNVREPLTQEEIGAQIKDAWNIQPPQSCNGCHR